MQHGRDLGLLQPFRTLRTHTGFGEGLAACPSLGLLVTSDLNMASLSVWDLPSGASGCNSSGGAGGGGLRLVCKLGGARAVGPMRFKFCDGGGYSGYLAFTPPVTTSHARPLLLVTDAGHDAVHVVDVVGRTHEGYVACPGSIAGPRGVAASASTTPPLVAVSAWKESFCGDHVIILYRRNSVVVWETVQVIGGGFGRPGPRDGQLNRPHGLRFNGDGSVICVADRSNDRASMFRVDNGDFVRHIDTSLCYPKDVEEVEGGWLVACTCSHTVVFVSDGGDDGGGGGWPSLGKAGGGYGSGDGELHNPVALATVPGLGLAVRDCWNGRLQVFATPDTIAMLTTNMSGIRIAWMSAVARAVLNRHANVVVARGHWCRVRVK
jgi:DNA-binding beta-propeller fold protein YncE